MNLPSLPADKANHFVYGACAAALGGLHSVLAGLMLCALLAIAKEVRDRVTRRGTPDLLDALATVAGGLVALLPLAAWRLGVVL
jgi:hypothetical protein